MVVKPRINGRTRLLSPVIRSIKELKDPKGSHVRSIIKRVQDIIDASNIKPKPRNVVMHVKEALKHGIEYGLLKYLGGRYKLSICDNNSKDEKSKMMKDTKHNFCQYCKKKLSLNFQDEEPFDRSASSVSEDDDSDVATYSKRGACLGRRKRRRSCGKKRRRRRRSSCKKKRRRRRRKSCGKKRRRRSRRRKSKCGRRRRRKSTCGRRKKKKSSCRRRRRKSNVCFKMNEKDVVANERGDRSQKTNIDDQEFKSNNLLNTRQAKSPSSRRAQSDENSVEDLQQFDPSGQCRNPECSCANERRSRSRRSSKHSRLERNDESPKKEVHYIYKSKSKDI